MSSHVPESIRRKEKRDAILKAQEVAAALTSENVCFLELGDGIVMGRIRNKTRRSISSVQNSISRNTRL